MKIYRVKFNKPITVQSGQILELSPDKGVAVVKDAEGRVLETTTFAPSGDPEFPAAIEFPSSTKNDERY